MAVRDTDRVSAPEVNFIYPLPECKAALLKVLSSALVIRIFALLRYYCSASSFSGKAQYKKVQNICLL